MAEATDWTAYYQRTPSYTKVTRAISTRKLVGILRKNGPSGPLDICELGGANSCFVDEMYRALPIRSYHIVDMNEFGLSLLDAKNLPSLSREKGDVLVDYRGERTFDIVYSVGLIEHFDREGTRKAVATHFQRCRPGGLVLITFPTPTFLYRSVRTIAEAAGKWAFPDERPLLFDEVKTACRPFGTIVHESINWPIMLTQGYIAVRKL